MPGPLIVLIKNAPSSFDFQTLIQLHLSSLFLLAHRFLFNDHLFSTVQQRISPPVVDAAAPAGMAPKKIPKTAAKGVTTTITKTAVAQTKNVLSQQQCLEMVQIMIHGSVRRSSPAVDTVLTALSS